jgi:dTDP-L-rhamnose 4-epimerase
MAKKVLVTGGAGFIGSHLVDNLIAKGHQVKILDSLEPQVHAGKPDYLNPNAEFILGDVRNEDVLKKALKNIEVVFHHAAAVGVGQSMYQIYKYTDINLDFPYQTEI